MAEVGERSILPVATEPTRYLLESRHKLPAAHESAGAARRIVRDALLAVDRPELVDIAVLAVSEVVTNATLHAHTPIELWVGVSDNQVCVEVRDFNPALPVQRHYDDQATTGRGMGLIAALASACGVQALGEDGKVVWFCLSDEPEEVDSEALLAAWDIDELRDDSVASGDAREVMLLSMPATLWLSAHQYQDALLREFVLYQVAHSREPLDLAAADAARAVLSTAVVRAVERAQAAGTAEPALPAGHPSPLPWVPKQLDLPVRVAAGAAASFAALQDVLDSAERLAVDGKLLLRPPLPEITAVRDWACEQVIAQLAGNTASPWPGTDQERFEDEFGDGVTPSVPKWDTSVVTSATTGVIAADDANRILAISDSLAALLGWEPRELVGRRVVAVIPPTLREGHVAGFSRHLSTGEAHILGVPLDLPVLCKNGTEIRCRFVVERAPLGQDRAVYLAWIDPLEANGSSDTTEPETAS